MKYQVRPAALPDCKTDSIVLASLFVFARVPDRARGVHAIARAQVHPVALLTRIFRSIRFIPREGQRWHRSQ